MHSHCILQCILKRKRYYLVLFKKKNNMSEPLKKDKLITGE